MAGIIDLREDPRIDLQIATSLGQGINQGIQEYRRSKLEAGIVGTLQRGIASGLTPDQMRTELLKIPDIVNSQIGNELFQAQTGTGRYYQNPLTTQYLQSRINANEALTRQRENKATGTRTDITKINQAQKFWQNVYDNAETGSQEEQDAKANLDALKEQARIVPQKKELPLGVSNQLNNIDQPALGTNSSYQFPNVTHRNVGLPANQFNPFNMPNLPAGVLSGNEMAVVEQPQKPLPVNIASGINAIDQTALGMNIENPTLPASSIFQTKPTTNSPAGLEEIWNELDDEEKQTALWALKQGRLPEQIVSIFNRNK